MAEEASGDVLLHPGLVISDHYEHRVPEVLPVQVHRADEVLPVVRKSCLKSLLLCTGLLPPYLAIPRDRAVAQLLLVLDMVCPPDVDSYDVHRLGSHSPPPPIVDFLKIITDDIGKSLPGKL